MKIGTLNNNTTGGLLILLGLMIPVIVFIFHDYLFFNKLYLFKDIGSDTLNGFYPRIVHNSDILLNFDLPLWSFQQGLGQNIFPTSIGNPFELPLLLLGRENIPYAIIYVEICKIIMAGLCFYLYLNLLDFSAYSRIMGSLLFAFSGVMILGSGWYDFSSAGALFALLLYAFERNFLYRNWVLFPIAVALTACTHAFLIAIFGIFFLIYTIFRFTDQNGWSPKALITCLTRLGALALLGVLISMFFFLPHLLEMLNSQRVAGTASLRNQLFSFNVFENFTYSNNINALLSFFSNDLQGTGNAYQGRGNYLEGPMYYCGSLTLLLLSHGFKGLNRRRATLFAVFFFVFIIPVFFDFFRSAFWLFSAPYYRTYCLFVILAMLFIALRGLDFILQERKLSLPSLGITLGLLLVILLTPYSREIAFVDTEKSLVISLLVIIYASLLLLLRVDRLRQPTLIILMFVVCAELAWSGSVTVNQRDMATREDFHEGAGYNDHTKEVVSYLKQKDPTFYRIEKTYSSSPAMNYGLNDSRVQNYYGTRSYHSFNQRHYVDFSYQMGVIKTVDHASSRWLMGLISRPDLLSFVSVKYLLVKALTDIGYPQRLRYRYVTSIGDIIVLENPAAYPLAVSYDSFVTADNFRKLPPEGKDRLLLNAFVTGNQELIDNKNFKQLSKEAIQSGLYVAKPSAGKTEGNQLRISRFSQNSIAGNIHLDSEKLLLFTIPYDKGWQAEINGRAAPFQKVSFGFMGLVIPPGDHAVELTYRPPYFWVSFSISLISIIGLLFMVIISKASGQWHLRRAN